MKSFKFRLSFLLPIFLVLFLSSSLSALVIVTDNFDSDVDGWSASSQSSGKMNIDSDTSTSKTYALGALYANREITVYYNVYLPDEWDNSDNSRRSRDSFGAYINDIYIDGYYSGGGTYAESFTGYSDGSGNIKVGFYTGSDSSDEYAEVDYVRLEGTPNGPPVIQADTFSIYVDAPIGTTVGNVVATNSPTSFSINSGDTDSLFAIDNSGTISVATTIKDNNSTVSYDLNISATNAYGSDTEIIHIDLVLDIPLSSDDINTRIFDNVPILGKDSVNINGAILQIGNQILCKKSSDFATCTAPTEGTTNNFNTQYFARIDDNVSHSNTMAKLVMLPGDEIIFARLYWSARIVAVTSTEKESAKNIKIKGPNSLTYTPLTSLNQKYNWYDDGSVFDYGASADVTEYVKTNGAGEYYVGDITSETGRTDIYASWQLIVVVQNDTRSVKNISVYDGFQSVYSGAGYPDSVDINASGFITPTGVDPFNANLFIYAGESDYGYADSSSILRVDSNGNESTLDLVDGLDDPDEVMNASVSSPDYTDGYRSNDAGMADPNFKNVLGVDIDKLVINDKNDPSSQILANSQTRTTITIASAGDRYSLNMFALETEVFIPEFCYDYAYKQNSVDFTEENDGLAPPKLSGNVVVGEPIEMKIFLKSQVDSEITIDNMTIDITGIDNSQVLYIDSSAELAKVGEIYPNPANPTVLTVDGNTSLNDIDVGTLNQNDYFYLYYKLNPQTATLDTPIEMKATYELRLGGSDAAEYTLYLYDEIPMCINGSNVYEPANGIFNIVNNAYYNASTTYYNLPTQVTNRVGDFKVISLDYPSNQDTLKTTSTMVAVEMIDVTGFHYTDASCTELESAITSKKWVLLDNTNAANFNNSIINSDFYTEARENAAFRVSYNTDTNGSLQLIESSGSGYKLTAFTSTSSDMCLDTITNDVPSQCGLTGNGASDSGMSVSELESCMECIYGKKTKLVCSKDNFAIRPEAFMIKLKDKDQVNTINADVPILPNISGVVTPDSSATVSNLSSYYQYDLNITATNHIDNNPSPGYIKGFGSSTSDVIEYLWAPGATTVSSCVSIASIPQTFQIFNGMLDVNTSVGQVGKYTLHVKDTTWTSVDWDSAYLGHHSGGYFTNTFDCIENSNVTKIAGASFTNATPQNGCNIDSNHDNSYGGTSNLKYRDYNIEFHPYKFNMAGVIPSHGINAPASTVFDTNTFIYMTDINFNSGQDQNMSLHLNGDIVATGYDGTVVSNFVDNCYAKHVTLTLNKTASTGATTHNYRFINTNIPANNQNGTMPNATASINLNTNDFNGTVVGGISTILNLNLDRNSSNSLNPERVTYSSYTSACTTPTNCSMIAGTDTGTLGTSISTSGSRDLNQTVNPASSINMTFLYGRTHASRQRYEVPVAGPATGIANIYYEAYCFGTIGGNTCLKTLLPQGLNSVRTDDIRWYANTSHTTNEGSAGTTTQINDGADVTGTTVNGNIALTNPNTSDQSIIRYTNSENKGYPYKTTMENSASRWLIYNQNDINATRNSFSVEFVKRDSSWSGADDANITTMDPATVKSNRRSNW